MPQHETTPRPVTATRRCGDARAPSELGGDELVRLADGLDALELGLVDGDAEGLLERHHELDEVEAVGVEVVAKRASGTTFSAGTCSTSTAQLLNFSKVASSATFLLLYPWASAQPFHRGQVPDRQSRATLARRFDVLVSHPEAAVDGNDGAGDVARRRREARNSTAAAISSGSARRPSGTDAAIFSSWSSLQALSACRSRQPGATTLTVIVRLATSRARERAKPISPAFEAA